MSILISAALCLATAAIPVTEDTWPGFRGDGTNLTPAHDLPLEWSPVDNIAWSVSVRGYGQSSPVIWNDRVFVSSVEGEEKETSIVTSINLSDGKTLWQHAFPSAQRIENTSFVSKAAPTPATDARGVYVFFESGDLIALSHGGEVLWQKNLSQAYGIEHARHGLGSSVAQTEDTLFVLVEQADPSLLIAFDKATGAERWKTGRDGRTSWTSPVVAELGGRETLLISSATSLIRYDAKTGEALNTLDGLNGISIPSPTVAGDIVVVGANSTRAKDGVRTAEQSNCAVRLSASGEPGFDVIWEGDGAQADYASPLIHRGNVYFVTARGDVQCRDLATGAVRYVERVHPCWATPVAAGDRIYLFGKEGACTVIEAGNEFKLLAENRLWNEIAGEAPAGEDGEGEKAYKAPKTVLYAVAAVDHTLLARTGKKLIAIRNLTLE